LHASETATQNENFATGHIQLPPTILGVYANTRYFISGEILPVFQGDSAVVTDREGYLRLESGVL